jgi:predicted lipid-binding transport protein (Tim44 family)
MTSVLLTVLLSASAPTAGPATDASTEAAEPSVVAGVVGAAAGGAIGTAVFIGVGFVVLQSFFSASIVPILITFLAIPVWAAIGVNAGVQVAAMPAPVRARADDPRRGRGRNPRLRDSHRPGRGRAGDVAGGVPRQHNARRRCGRAPAARGDDDRRRARCRSDRSLGRRARRGGVSSEYSRATKEHRAL